MMEDRLRRFIDSLFEDAPQSSAVLELKEEMILNLIDKYSDLRDEGRSEESAYNIAVAGVGDVRGLIDEIERRSGNADEGQERSRERARKKSATLVAAAVALYILCVVPVILISNRFGVILMFLFVAAATALLIYNGMTKSKYVRMDETVVEEFKEWKAATDQKRQTFNALSSALWAVCVVAYFILSFATGAWHVTWILFLIAGAFNAVLKAVMELKGQGDKK